MMGLATHYSCGTPVTIGDIVEYEGVRYTIIPEEDFVAQHGNSPRLAEGPYVYILRDGFTNTMWIESSVITLVEAAAKHTVPNPEGFGYYGEDLEMLR